jgi:endo-1,4-beta-xylanase
MRLDEARRTEPTATGRRTPCPRWGAVLLTALAGAAPGCALLPDGPPRSTIGPDPSLRELARTRRLWIGAAVMASPLVHDSAYAATARREFNIVTTENALKFEPLRPAPDEYDFQEADLIVKFARTNGMRLRGHTLVWKRQLPSWLTAVRRSREDVIALLRDHIHTVVGRYRERIYAWDVVNEAVQLQGEEDSPPLRATFWLETIGPEYIDLAFRFAREADPQARLFYNDGIGSRRGPKAEAVIAFVRSLLRREVPLNGVGLQLHVSLTRPPDVVGLTSVMRELSDLGLEVHVTEMDVATDGYSGTQEEKEARQAQLYGQILKACLTTPRCTTFVTWGFTDRYTWLYPDTPLPFDADYRPKPARRALIEALSEH